MRIGLIDVDGHNFSNLALMRISAWHKAQGDQVEWWLGDLFHYDLVYKSKVFSDTYSKDTPDPLNCDRVIKGGTGYNISLQGGGGVLQFGAAQESTSRNGEDVSELFHLSAIQIRGVHDKSRLPTRMRLLPCCRERGKTICACCFGQ